MNRPRLEDYPGLTEAPAFGSEDHAAMVFDLCEALDPYDLLTQQSRDECAAETIRFMVKRGYWPLGTRGAVFWNGASYEFQAEFPRVVSRAVH